ncbi:MULTISPECIES: DUF3952 domain-containing protein [unclassified Bacillus (in: firmicutes)]|uniref:DUF3952 domain-containing protein n=1 Tax=unclassified Bacillus (in: firmicutes) TaxID=185979 RepID=UPI0008F4219A|nr:MULTISPECIES: DUF3952 domain-containing protein [unclassified Bacillus (in: firmicutes)]SFK19552.1 protein of unknown function [Bacillus sp. 71mf]SFT01225.1 protein of unknown function [Bacillus sp. 103mf]
MKKKTKVKGMIIMTIVASLLGGCGSSKPEALKGTKIEYERLVKALDEGDMQTVMTPSDDGYAYVQEQGIYSTYEEKEDGEHSKIIYQTTEGVYNTKDKSLYGDTTQNIVTDIKNEKEAWTNKNYKKENVYNTNILYKKGQGISSNQNLDVSTVKFIIDRLQGIGKLKPKDDRQGFDEPKRIYYSLTESQFQEIINDKLQLQYDKFRNATISLYFTQAKDYKENPMEIDNIDIVINYDKKAEEGKMLQHGQQIIVNFRDKEYNTENAKTKYLEYEKSFNSNK